MAEQSVTGALYDSITNVFEATTDLLTDTIQGFASSATDYRFDYDVFPEDLGSEQLGHYMIIKLYTPGKALQIPYGPLSSGFSQNNYNVALFMPTESGGGIFPTFEDTHEYPDISMSNVFLNQIGASKVLRGAAAMTGRAINPAVQVLYKTTHLRKFDFAFLFAPRSEEESKRIERIIKKIRSYAAPLDEGMFFRSPAEVEIEFHHMGQRNPHVIIMKRQVITNINVQYAPQGTYSTFTNGHPVSVMFAMSTREMEIIDRADVEAGY